MQTFPIDHIAALELIDCRNSNFDDAPGLSGLGRAWDDSRTSYRQLMEQYTADVAVAAPTGFYRDNYNAFAQASKLLNDASNMSDMWMSSGNLDDDSYKNEMNMILTQAQAVLNGLESQMPAAAPAVAAVAPVSVYNQNYPGFVGPPAPSAALSSQYAQVVQNNPQTLVTPQPGTTPVNANTAVAQNIANVLSSGAGVYTQQQIQSVLNQAKNSNNPVYVPQHLVSQVKAKSSSSGWLIAAGIGVAVLAGVSWFALHRRQ